VTSERFTGAFNAAETEEVLLILLTLTDQLNEKHRFVNNTSNITSRGNLFEAYPFEVTLPDSTEGRISSCSITFDNVGRKLIDEIRTQTKPMQVLIEVILAAEPDVVQAKYEQFEWRGLSYNPTTISGTATIESFLQETYPKKRMNNQTNPGLFFS